MLGYIGALTYINWDGRNPKYSGLIRTVVDIIVIICNASTLLWLRAEMFDNFNEGLRKHLKSV